MTPSGESDANACSPCPTPGPAGGFGASIAHSQSIQNVLYCNL